MTPEERAQLRAAAEQNITVRDVQLAPDIVLDLLDLLDALDQLLAAERRDADTVESELRSELDAMTERAERAERERDVLDHEAKLLRESAKQAWTVADGTRTALARADAEVSRLRGAMPTDEERAALVQVFDEAWFQDRDKLRQWLARLNAVRNGG